MTREIGSEAPQRPLGSLAESTPIRWAVNLAPPRQQTFSGDYNRDMYIYIYVCVQVIFITMLDSNVTLLSFWGLLCIYILYNLMECIG